MGKVLRHLNHTDSRARTVLEPLPHHNTTVSCSQPLFSSLLVSTIPTRFSQPKVAVLNGCAGGYYANSSGDIGTSSSSGGGSIASNSTANCISGSLGGDVETYMATLVSTNACASVVRIFQFIRSRRCSGDIKQKQKQKVPPQTYCYVHMRDFLYVCACVRVCVHRYFRLMLTC